MPVIARKGDQTCALMGAIIVNQCKAMKLGGIVLDAEVRDVLELRELGFPVFAAATNPIGSTKWVPGHLKSPVSVDGVTVHPGDQVAGDADGVVIMERGKAAALLTLAVRKVADEAAASRASGLARNCARHGFKVLCAPLA